MGENLSGRRIVDRVERLPDPGAADIAAVLEKGWVFQVHRALRAQEFRPRLACGLDREKNPTALRERVAVPLR
jgi:hypothetical protein